MNFRLGPVGLILLIAAARYHSRRQQLSALPASNFPHVRPERFEDWRRGEIRSIDVFLWTAGIFTAIGLVASIFLSSGAASRREPSHAVIIALVLLVGGNILTLFAGLTISAVHGSRAARLRKKLGIYWPSAASRQPKRDLVMAAPRCAFGHADHRAARRSG